jgi:hypothetical protein
MTLDEELTRLEERAAQRGFVIVPRALRQRLLKYLPVKSMAHQVFVSGDPIHIQLDLQFVLHMTAAARNNIARLAAQKLTQ